VNWKADASDGPYAIWGQTEREKEKERGGEREKIV
jgi:hypothetical protein